MSTNRAFGIRTTGIAGAAAVALVVGCFAIQANATGSEFALYDEGDSPNPLSVTEGLVYSKGADLGWVVNVPIADIDSLAYTVDSSISTSTPVAAVAYAPSYQLVAFVDRDGGTAKYTRLVWEPYMQDGELNPSQGEYADLEDGVWWTNKIANPAPGSQSDPQPLEFFGNGAGAGWNNVNVYAVTVKQGTTTDVTSVVTGVSFNGHDFALGNADVTPFDQDYVDGKVAAAVSPVQAALDAYKANHHTADGASIGTSRVVLGDVVAGTTASVKLEGTLAASTTPVKYQWYVSNKPVAGATKATYKVPANYKGKTITVKVTGTYKNIVFGVTSNGVVAK